MLGMFGQLNMGDVLALSVSIMLLLNVDCICLLKMPYGDGGLLVELKILQVCGDGHDLPMLVDMLDALSRLACVGRQ